MSDPITPAAPLTATYKISTGQMWDADSQLVGVGYAGNNSGISPCINDPNCCNVKMHGPLPPGLYEIGAPVDKPESVGAFALPLLPNAANEMFGRGSFYVHGDNPQMNQSASDGCIVLAREYREVVAQHQLLNVIE
jgi:hypothetical protein